jgi:hypothetical protein
VLVVMDIFTRRIIDFGVAREYIDGISVCRMFNQAVAGQPRPKHLSTDHDPLFPTTRKSRSVIVLLKELAIQLAKPTGTCGGSNRLV